MDINTIINTAFNCASVLLAIIAALVFVTNIIVEVLKVFVPKLPSSYLAVIVAITVTVLALLIAAAIMKITVMWYYAVGAVVLGIFVAYAAMFGFDKFKDTWGKLSVYKHKEIAGENTIMNSDTEGKPVNTSGLIKE